MRAVFRSTLLCLVMIEALVGQSPAEPPPQVAPRLDDATFATLWSQVLPDPHELEWQEIPWRAVLADAVRQAQAADQPILLWAMNGHPLGCT